LRPVWSKKTTIEVVNETPRNLTAHADAGLIAQVFQNLLDNTFKYTPHGRVTVAARDAGGTVICEVRDNGAGIAPEVTAKVFDKFTTDPAQEGTGLGPAIVKQIVDAHGGTVTVEISQGVGATFRFTIPEAPMG
jgi:two-component system, sensor histidine kinase ChiS